MIKFASWLGNEVTSLFNPIALSYWKFSQQLPRKTANNNHSSTNQILKSNKGNDKKKIVNVYWPCKSDLKVSACDKLKQRPEERRSALVKEHRLCFDCLFNDRMLKEYKSKFSCGVEGCHKCHHTLLHNPNYKRDNKEL